MEFFIKKNATLPLLKLQVVKDGRSDYNNFMELLETSSIFFSMVNSDTGIPKIISKPAGFVEKTFIDPNAEPEYYIYYQFTNTDTNTVGKFEGQFLVKTDDGNLILPIREKLFIYVQESFIADDLTYENCYTSVYPCCIGPGYSTPTPTQTGTPTPTPTPTNTQTETPTPTPTNTQTPTSTFTPLELTLEVEYTPGSLIATYNLYLNRLYNEEINVTFENILEFFTGSPISIFTGVTIPLESISGQTVVVVDVDYNDFTGYPLFSQLSGTPNGSAYEIILINPPTPTPTPSNTATPIPTPTSTPSDEVLINPIITDNSEYISVGNDFYLEFIDEIPPFYYYYNLLKCDLSSNSVGRSINGGLTGVYNVDINTCYSIVGSDLGPSYTYNLDLSTVVTDCNDSSCLIPTPTPTPTPTTP
jgi:hypothetical protein